MLSLMQQKCLQMFRFLHSMTVFLLSTFEKHPSNSIIFSIQNSHALLNGCEVPEHFVILLKEQGNNL